EMAEVWVTFVHEGAGWTNALGYYTYTEGNAPATVLDITDLTLIFPNTSFAGSGGGLYAGDKVYLGTFAANTVIEWFQVAQGWNNTQDTVGHGVYTHYSQAHLNIESDPGLRQHNILLYDATRELILLGFEDIDRESYICDHDFNDAIFYATVTPFTAVDPQNLPPIDTPDDTDNDGVSDAFDEYPTDPDRAYNFWLPGEGEFGTLAFEDLWPEKGDYDFNDIVIDYQYQIVASASNELVEAFAKYVLQATGASYHNGFGIELPLLPSQIASVTGGDYSTGLTNRAANGTETGQTNAVIIAFEDGFSLLAYPGTGIGVNTSPGSTWVEPDTLTQMISFVSGITLPNIGTTPFNPFIFANQNRGIEVHLIDNPPTNLADMLLFGTADDNSSPMYGQFYKTQNLLPWAIHIPESFDYPIEKEEVNQAHLKFTDWAESGGILYPDWYQNKSGYRNAALIY
ncbi:MAG: LruC domain-containing protein, partial [Bacteroidota bacterium]|nr:LruC domain-containing protein [Bacteroidota bacterium]